MKFKTEVNLSVLSPRSLYDPVEFLESVRTLCELLPEITPEKWDWYEPLRNPFRVNNMIEMIPTNGKNCETTYWKRTRKPKAEGSFDVRWRSAVPRVLDSHSHVDFAVELGQVSQDSLVHWLKTQSHRSRAHIALIDTIVESRRGFLQENEMAPYGGHLYLVTHVLRHWLPDVFWGTVFGAPYVALFAKDRLLSAPVAVVEEIADDMIYVQLTEKLTDVVDAEPSVAAARAAFKRHVAVDAFYESAHGYSLHDSEAVGDVFVVPEFELDKIED
jgi:hypothetical protein